MFSIIIPTMQKNVKVLNMLLDELVCDNHIGEIILIDNSLKGFDYKSDKVRVITPDKNIYVNPAWNLGVENARFEYVGILNDDLIFPKNYFSCIYNFITGDKNIGFVGLDIIPKTTDECFTDYPADTEPEFINITFHPPFWGSAFFFERKKYFKIPEELKVWCGDDFLFYKSLDEGFNNYSVANSNVMHLHSLTSNLNEFHEIKSQDQLYYSKINPQFASIKPKKYTLLQKLFSIKNNFSDGIKRKIIYILGIKISIKTHQI